jgi:hypothetical protein
MNITKTITLLLAMCLMAHAEPPASDKPASTATDEHEKIKFGGQWGLKTTNSLLEVTQLQNVSETPVRAFRCNVYFLNDFGEVDSKETIEFTGDVLYVGGRERGTGHTIQKGEVIYLTKLIMVDKATRQIYATARNEILEELGGDQKALSSHRIDPKRLRFELEKLVPSR